MDFSFNEYGMSFLVYFGYFCRKPILLGIRMATVASLLVLYAWKSSYSPSYWDNDYHCCWNVFLLYIRMIDSVFCIHSISLCLFAMELSALMLTILMTNDCSWVKLITVGWTFLFSILSRAGLLERNHFILALLCKILVSPSPVFKILMVIIV